MAVEVGSAYVSIVPSFSGFGGKLTQGIGDSGTKAGEHIGKTMGDGAMGSVAGLGKKLLIGAGIGAGFSFLGDLISEARESAKVAAITSNAIRSTGGAAKITAGQVGDLATAISMKTGADDEAVQSGQNLLLTFTGIQNQAGKGNDIFNQASSTLVDMTAAMNNGSVSSEAMKATAIQLGKALNDPAKGMTALTKVGVTFTDQQKSQIAAMEKAGNMAGAQKIVLGELNREFGGTAAAASNPMQKLGVMIGNVKEQLGGFLLPVVDKFATVVATTVIPYLSNLATNIGPSVGAAFQFIGSVISTAFTTLQPALTTAWGLIKNLFAAFNGSTSNVSPAWLKTLGSVKTIAMDVYKALSDVGRLVGSVFAGATGVGEYAGAFSRIKTALSGVFTSVMGYYKVVIPIIREIVDAIVNKFHELQPKIAVVMHTVLDIIKSVFQTISLAFKIFTGIVSFIWGAWGADILKFISGTFNAVVDVVSAVFTVIKGIFDVVLGLLTGNWGRAWNGIKEIFSGVWGAVVGTLQEGWLIIKTAVLGVIDIFVHLWDVLFGHSIIPDMVAGFAVAWGAIKAGWNLLVTAFSAIWEGVLKPVFHAVAAIVTWLWQTVFQVALAGIKLEWQGLVTVFNALWNSVLKPVFSAVAAIANWLWENVVKVAFAGMKAEWNLLTALFKALWDTVLHPMFNTVATVAEWLWQTVIKVVFAGMKAEWNLLVNLFKQLWDNVLHPVFNTVAAIATWLWQNVAIPVFAGIRAAWSALIDGIKILWTNVLKPTFDTIGSVISTVAGTIGRAWDGLASAFSNAFNGAKQAVINGWNAIADWVDKNVIGNINATFAIHIPSLPKFAQGGAVQGLATGGPVRGPGTATSDSIMARLSNGEFVMKAAAVKAIGVDTLNKLNDAHRIQYTSGDASGMAFMAPGFADGGLVSSTKAWIQQQAGKPYVMNATGPGAWDCSGLVGAVWALLSGKNPNQRYFSTVTESGFFKPGLGGPHSLSVGYYGGGGGSGHTVGVLDGLHFEATPPHVLVGNTNYTPESGLFTGHGHLDVGGTDTLWGWLYDHTIGDIKNALSGALGGLGKAIPDMGILDDVLRGVTTKAVSSLTFDGGGLLPQGQWLVDHKATEPDRVLSDAQWKVAAAAMDSVTGGQQQIVIHVHPRAEHSEADTAAMVQRELAWVLK